MVSKYLSLFVAIFYILVKIAINNHNVIHLREAENDGNTRHVFFYNTGQYKIIVFSTAPFDGPIEKIIRCC